MPLLPGGIPGFEITLHINTVCIRCWLVRPFNLYILRLLGARGYDANAIVAPVGNAGLAIRNTNHNTGR